MPEGDTIFRAARSLQRALGGQTITRFESVVPKLARVAEDEGIVGRSLDRVEARGKWLLFHFSGDLTLVTHMLMSGSWHIYRPGEKWHRPKNDMRVIIGTTNFDAVAFRIPVAEFHDSRSLRRRAGLNELGPDVLDPAFDIQAAVQSLRQYAEMELGNAVLKQSVLAGPGNVFKSEICFVSELNPFRQIKTLDTQELTRVATTAHKLMCANVSHVSSDKIVTYTGLRRTTGRSDPYARLWVYGRAGMPCRRCGTPIEVRRQGTDARKTYYCPECQK